MNGHSIPFSALVRAIPFSALVRVLIVGSVAIGLGGCTYLERGRRFADAAAAVNERLKIEALVQLQVERQRVRQARCFSPLLTPSTLSAAALDSRLGTPWVDELLRDCPQFSAFLAELLIRRARASFGIDLAEAAPSPARRAPRPAASAESGEFVPAR